MKNPKTILLTLAVLAASICPLTSSAETVDNATVLKMLSKGYTSDIIIGYIDAAQESAFTADMDAIDALIAAGADSQLITYIQQCVKKSTPSLNGMYWWNANNGQPVKLNLSALAKEEKGIGGRLLSSVVSIAGTAAGISTGSLGGISAAWIAGDVLASSNFKSEKLTIHGERATTVVIGSNPVFRFAIPTAEILTDNPANFWYYQWLTGVQTPSEFQLIRLSTKGKGKKAKRVFPSGLTWTAAGFSTSSQNEGKDLVDFSVRQINDNLYEITFPEGLEPGEYAFFYRNALSEAIKDHLSAFDFSVE